LRLRVQQNSLRIGVDKAPLPIGRHRVSKFLAEEAESVGRFYQFLDVGRVSLELLVEARDGARVLYAAEDELLFALALALLIDAGQRGSQGDQHHGGYHHDQQ
jgi:hypothetical protein